MPETTDYISKKEFRSTAAVHRWFPCLLVISGALGLVYEVLWQRSFALLFGSSAAASAAVLAAYFTGLFIGAVVLGKVARRASHPLRLYGILELAVGLGALAVDPILSIYAGIYPSLYQSYSASPVVFNLIKSLLAIASIAIPTIAMGGTLPVLARLYEQERNLGKTAGWLYVLNTVGAAAGALAVPFVALRYLGAHNTTLIAAGLNITVGLAAFWFSSKLAAHPASEEQATTTSRYCLFLSAMSGLIIFALQVLWNRAFAQVHENSIYSFALFVSLFILALAVGGQITRLFLARGKSPFGILGWSWFAGGIATAVASLVFIKATNSLSYLPGTSGWMGYASGLVALSAKTFLLPIVILGMGFPALMQLIGGEKGIASIQLGRLLAANLGGSVLGALLAGFLLPRILGLWPSMGLTAAILIAFAPNVIRKSNGLKIHPIIALVLAMLFWNMFRSSLPRLKLTQNSKVIAIKEGPHGIVAVVDSPDSRRIKLNNYYQLGGTMATGDERMQAHIPLLIHPNPTNILFLGYGTGITAGSALFHTNVNVEAVELVREVVELAPYFKEFTEDFGSNPRSKLITEDARNHLRGTSQKYDVIIGDLVVPWRQGEGALYTKEHFEAVRDALNTNGIYCAWLPLFQLSRSEFDIIVRTFFTVFDSATVWRGDFSPTQPALGLVASPTLATPLPAGLAKSFSRIKPDPANPHLLGPAAVTMHYVGTLTRSLLPSGSELNTEDRPRVELLGPMLHSGQNSSNLFVGYPLLQWQRELTANSVSSVAQFGPDELAGWKAGLLMAEFADFYSEGNQPAARQVLQQMKTVLPANVFQALFPGE